MEQIAHAIAYLSYAIIEVDGRIDQREKNQVHEFINENWQNIADTQDPFGVRTMDYVDKAIVQLEKKGISSEKAFEAFKELHQLYGNMFTKEIKAFLIQLCIYIGSSVNRLNKSELVLLSQIEKILKSG